MAIETFKIKTSFNNESDDMTGFLDLLEGLLDMIAALKQTKEQDILLSVDVIFLINLKKETKQLDDEFWLQVALGNYDPETDSYANSSD